MTLLDSMLRVLRLTYAGPATFRISRDEMSTRAFEVEALNLFGAAALLVLCIIALSVRFALYGSNRVFITGDSENGAVWAALSLLCLVGFRVAQWFGTRDVLQDSATACLSLITMETLATSEVSTIAIVLMVVHSADLHGYFRPPVWLRASGALLILGVGLWTALELGSDWGAKTFVSESTGEAGDMLFDCERLISPDYIATGTERVIMGLRMVVATVLIVFI